MTVQIVTDSGSDLTAELAASLQVEVAPLRVLLGGTEYRDGVDLSPDSFYAKMREQKELPKTSQPSLVEMEAAYRRAAERGPVLGIHLSSALSGTYQSAVMAARAVDPEIPVFDSLTGSGGLALLVMEAVRLAREGADRSRIVAEIQKLRKQTHVVVALNTLENAVRGGRVSPVTGMAASLLGVKPIVHVTEAGRVEQLDRARGRSRALQRLLEIAGDLRRDWSGARVFVAHGSALAEAQSFAAQVRERFNPAEVILAPIGASIGTYAAEGAILFSF